MIDNTKDAQRHSAMLVYTTDEWGIGSAVARTGDDIVVRFFHSIARQTERTYAVHQLKRPWLTPQTRVYFQHQERWYVGRVIGRDEREYEVQLPNHHAIYLNEDDFEVRCLQPLDDPTEVLAIGGSESQYLHDRRRLFLDAIVRLRAASRGMTGATSAAIELVTHQLQVAHRVLSDPVQRYLLADEVGMGKTIEAGIIIRQCLLDDETATVLVLTPEHLVGQWQEELHNRFQLDDFPDRLAILPYHDLQSNHCRHPPKLLVVDEAHRALATGYEGINAEQRAAIRQLGMTVERLLLLSATPSVGREAELLALLQVLDPVSYGTEDVAVFRRKVEQRDKYGLFLRGLHADASDFLLKQRAREAPGLFTGDDVVAGLANTLTAQLAMGDRPAIQQCVGDLRTHIAETYRLHHRLIRTRRADTEGWEFMPRGPQSQPGAPDLSHWRVEIDEDERLPELLQMIEQWRHEALYAVQQGADEVLATERFVLLIEALAQGVEQLSQVAHALTMQAPPVFAHEPALLDGMAEIALQEPGLAREELAIEVLRRLHRAIGENSHPKIVVFTSSTALARRLAAKLRQHFGDAAVHTVPGLLETEVSTVDQVSATERFHTDPAAWLYLCDRGGEEGQNLQFAEALLHYDLPFSANRMEQRIGRLDRFGRRKGVIRHRVIIPSDQDDSPWQAWFELLTESFQVFNTSLADVQFFLGDLQQRLALGLFREGAAGLRRLSAELVAAISAERQRLDNQYALDRVMAREEAATGLREAIEEAEMPLENLTDQAHAELLAALERPYKQYPDNAGYLDSNLGSRPQVLQAILDPAMLETLCRQVRERSRDLLLSTPKFADALAEAQSHAEQQIARRRRQIERRLAALAAESAGRHDASLEREIRYDEWVLAAVRQPSVRVDAIGLFVLASQRPETVLGVLA
ncbi:MAG: protein DpdE [Candidatus Competibacteraceae bacterium]